MLCVLLRREREEVVVEVWLLEKVEYGESHLSRFLLKLGSGVISISSLAEHVRGGKQVTGASG